MTVCVRRNYSLRSNISNDLSELGSGFSSVIFVWEVRKVAESVLEKLKKGKGKVIPLQARCGLEGG